MKQITILHPSGDGVVADIAGHLGAAGINIESLDAFVVHGWDFVQLTVDRYDKALHVLRDAGYDAVTEDADVLCVKDEPGALARVTQQLYEAGVHVQSIRILQRREGVAAVGLVADRPAGSVAGICDLVMRRTG